MSSKILQWVGLVYVVATAPLVDTFIRNTLISNSIKSIDQFSSPKQQSERELSPYNRMIEIYPNSTLRYNQRAFRKIELNDFQGALADFNRSIEIDPLKNAYAFSMRGLLKYRKLNDIQGAAADFNHVKETNPHDASIYIRCGLLKYQELNYPSGGIYDLKQANGMNNPENLPRATCSKIELAANQLSR